MADILLFTLRTGDYMKTLKVMTTNCGTVRTATLADDGEITFHDGSKSTAHLDLGIKAQSVLVAMNMFKDVFTKFSSTSTQASLFNWAIECLNGDKPNAHTAHIFYNLAGKKSVVMLNGDEHMFVKVGSSITSKATGNKYPNRYSYIDTMGHGFIEYIHYSNKRRVANFVDGSYWEIIVNDQVFNAMCIAYAKYNGKLTAAKWFTERYFTCIATRNLTNDLSLDAGFASSMHDKAPIFSDCRSAPYTVKNTVLYCALALAFIFLLGSCFLLNQCVGAP